MSPPCHRPASLRPAGTTGPLAPFPCPRGASPHRAPSQQHPPLLPHRRRLSQFETGTLLVTTGDDGGTSPPTAAVAAVAVVAAGLGGGGAVVGDGGVAGGGGWRGEGTPGDSGAIVRRRGLNGRRGTMAL